MAVLSPRSVIALALGVGIGAVLARRHAHEPTDPCCEPPAGGASCC
jgi:hypothetical protein